MPRRKILEYDSYEDRSGQKKIRKANWSYPEISLLLEEVKMERETIMSPLTNDVTNKKKIEVWTLIAERITEVCGVDTRTATNVRDKWGCLKSEALQRRDQRRRTVGAPVKEVHFDQTVFDILGENDAMIEGMSVQGTSSGTKTFVDPHDNIVIKSCVSPVGDRTEDDGDNHHITDASNTDGMKPLMSSTLQMGGGYRDTDAAETENGNPVSSPTLQLTVEDGLQNSGTSERNYEREVASNSASRHRVTRKKMWQPKGRRTGMETMQSQNSPLWEDFLRSEIRRNQSDIERNRSEIARNKSDVERNKMQIELMELQREKLLKDFSPQYMD